MWISDEGRLFIVKTCVVYLHVGRVTASSAYRVYPKYHITSI